MFLDDDPAKPVTAGGVIIYKYVKGKMMLLIIETDGKYEDIGGKIDPDDSDVFSAVAREVQEETNEQIMSEDILDRLKIASYVYVPRSKYVVYIVEATVQEKKLKKTDFGEMEEHDAFPRTIGWIARDALMKPQTIQYKMNWRLKSKELFDKLIDIEKDGMFKKKIFKKPIDDDDDDDDADEQ
jgi:8-oxo-dGTP pyrophosphatase MutT (NUDIX family)